MTIPRRTVTPAGVPIMPALVVLGVVLVGLVVTLVAVIFSWHTPAMEPVPVPTVASA